MRSKRMKKRQWHKKQKRAVSFAAIAVLSAIAIIKFSFSGINNEGKIQAKENNITAASNMNSQTDISADNEHGNDQVIIRLLSYPASGKANTTKIPEKNIKAAGKDDKIPEIKNHKKSETVSRRLGNSNSYKKEEIMLLEKLVMAEAGGEPYEGQIAVVNVVLNRLENEEFPDTLKGVIFQKGQFTPVERGTIWNMKPSKSVKNAVNEALNGKYVVDKDTLYFINPRTATNLWVAKNRKFAKKIGNHSFYK